MEFLRADGQDYGSVDFNKLVPMPESLNIQYMMIELQNNANKNQIAEFGKTSLWNTTNTSQ